jgi:hypothetical protein
MRLRAARTIHRISFRSRSTRGHYVCLPHGAKNWPKTRALRWMYTAIATTARSVDSTQVEAFKLVGFHGGALVTSKQVNGVFSHVATTETVYDKDIGHCLSRTGLVQTKAGLVDLMRKARGKGEVVNRAVSSSTQRGVAADDVGNVDSSWLNSLGVSAPSYIQQFDGALLDIRPGSEFPATLRRSACPQASSSLGL